eukprot:m.248709 g.248709  ORF g.248709 m.248709 type:complete len:334 (+) comp15418_c0_seq2:744-1745(+)
MSEPITVCVTGAAGQIAYSLLPMICRGNAFGEKQMLYLNLLDIEPMAAPLEGVVMELHDSSFNCTLEIRAFTDPMLAFKDADAAILVGAVPRREGMERKDLLARNASIFKVQGQALDKVAKKSVKVLVVGNPANTNALIASTFAPSIPKEQFTALTMLDMNRARSFVAQRAQVQPQQVKNVVIWGNHSKTQYPDVTHGTITTNTGTTASIMSVINDTPYLQGDFISAVQNRGGAIIKARKLSSAMSAAKAIADHMRYWFQGTAEGEFVSMAVMSDGSYGIKPGVVYSFPVTIKDGKISIVQDLPIDEFSREMMDKTYDELVQEKEVAMQVTAQ